MRACLRKSTAPLKLPCHLRSEKSNTSSPLISLSGPETAQALSQNLSRSRRAQRFIHHQSQFHRLFILPERPTSEAGPIKFSHSCPGACHLTRISPNTPSFSPFVSRYIVLTSHLSWFFFLFFLPRYSPNDAASLPLMRSELISKIMKRSRLANQRHVLELTQGEDASMNALHCFTLFFIPFNASRPLKWTDIKM